ncbi:hypothetical protein [Sporosarcina sp. YIM B06819]|uniref:hypothetical protein n=1 Tax=Sporosarcina sp. YIM B06819 TaxID=3081769 RepID=UPI00298CB555|nr:hypothetical protein [Sporosarcina sp. YIM B06819]
MTQKRRSEKYCIKNIKGKNYLYSWSYRPQYLRTKRKNQRFRWVYIGNYNSKTVQQMLKRLPLEMQESLRLSYEDKVRKFELKQDMMKSLELQEPYKSEIERISKINNRDNYLKEISQYERYLREVITQQLFEQQSTLKTTKIQG